MTQYNHNDEEADESGGDGYTALNDAIESQLNPDTETDNNPDTS